MLRHIFKFPLWTWTKHSSQECKSAKHLLVGVENESNHTNCVCWNGVLVIAIIILYVAVTCNAYITWQWRCQSNVHQIQLQELFDKVQDLATIVDHLFDQTITLKAPQPLQRKKRQSSSPVHFEHVFRWIDSDRKRVQRINTKRHTERLVEINTSTSEPSAEILMPPTFDQANSKFHWVDSSFRISVSIYQLETDRKSFDQNYGRERERERELKQKV